MRLLFLMLLTLNTQSFAQELVFAYGPGNGAPFAFTHNNQLVGGLYKDIGDRLATIVGLPVRYRHAPTNRASQLLNQNQVNAICLTNPAWIGSNDGVLWSPKIADNYDKLVTLKDKQLEIVTLEQMAGLQVGAMTGYVYSPDFMSQFDNGKTERRDFNSLQSLYASLFAERIDVAVDSMISIDYRIKTEPQFHHALVSPFTVYQFDLYCVFNRSLKTYHNSLNDAVNQMIATGELQQIFQQYR